MSRDEPIYKILFTQQGQTVELYARGVSQGGLFGFVEVSDLLFGERSQLVVDPSEEALQKEMEGVQRVYVPLHAVVRIDQVERQGKSRMHAASDGEGGTLKSFPVPMYTPGPGGSGSR